MKTLIIAGERIQDNHGSFKECDKILSSAQKKNLKVATLEIVNLAKRWEDNLGPNQFKSGASAMGAIDKARKLLSSKKADIVVIKGSDFLKTGYEKGAREGFMKLYKNKFTAMDGYDKLVPHFLKVHKVSEKDFFTVRDALFENYFRTWKEIKPDATLPDDRWFQPITKYFRGVDCANPNIDYQGQIILASDKTADSLKVPKKNRVEILGNAFIKLNVDGFESLPKVAPYLHLKKVIDKALKESKINFKAEFLKGKAFLDAYTCYPVVPMGLLLRLGLVKTVHEIPELLKWHEITVTGGLNLGKAAWNLTSLNAIIVMREKILSSKTKLGLVHGNGSLGNQQGITLLSR